MAKWELYCPRGFSTNLEKDPSKPKRLVFDPRHMEAGLAPPVSLYPQPIINGSDIIDCPELISDFVKWMHLRRNSGLELKLTAHARSELLDEAKAKRELDAIIEINKRYGQPLIRETVYHAGQVVSSKEELAARKMHGFKKGVAPFSAKDFLDKLNNARDIYNQLRKHGQESGIDVLVENLPVIEFESFDGNIKDKPSELKKDVRWTNTAWMPGQVQVGLLGSAYDLVHLLGMNGALCIDTEHLDQTTEYFASHFKESRSYGGLSFPIDPMPWLDLMFYYHTLSEETKFIESNFNIFMEQDIINSNYVHIYHARRFRNPDPYSKLPSDKDVFNPYKFIKWIGNKRISMAHLGGQVSMFYQDEGITKIGSHMPITFPGDPNEFIVDDKMREEQNALRKKKITNYLTTLHDAGCRKGVIEVHIGVYAGEKWRRYMSISKKNVESVLAKLD